MRIRYWSSDVLSSDLCGRPHNQLGPEELLDLDRLTHPFNAAVLFLEADDVFDDPVRQALADRCLDDVQDTGLAVQAADQYGGRIAAPVRLAERWIARAKEDPRAEALDPEGDGAEEGILFRSEEHTSELQSQMRTPYAVF